MGCQNRIPKMVTFPLASLSSLNLLLVHFLFVQFLDFFPRSFASQFHMHKLTPGFREWAFNALLSSLRLTALLWSIAFFRVFICGIHVLSAQPGRSCNTKGVCPGCCVSARAWTLLRLPLIHIAYFLHACMIPFFSSYTP